jgi:hypothetical protein
MKKSVMSMLLLAAGAICASTHVLGDDLLGVYVGAAVGQAHVRTTRDIVGDTDYDYEFDQDHTAWKALVGIRPIPLLGAELNYIDFGNASGGSYRGFFGTLTRASAKAVTLFGLGYVPLPIPLLDVYAKLGVARLHTTATEEGASPACPIGPGICTAPPPFITSEWITKPAYGVGAQAKYKALAVQLEYERISGSNPDLLSLGVTWTF